VARVDFYVLDRVDEHARLVLACKLAEKAWRMDNSIHIHTMSSADARQLDDLLWTFREGSFVPHAMAGAKEAAAITIGFGDTAESDVVEQDLLISLCDDIPVFASKFPRIAELLTADADCKSKGRKRFALYRDQGHTMETYKL
jgi:DNA polymerase-3 subunit chi